MAKLSSLAAGKVDDAGREIGHIAAAGRGLLGNALLARGARVDIHGAYLALKFGDLTPLDPVEIVKPLRAAQQRLIIRHRTGADEAGIGVFRRPIVRGHGQNAGGMSHRGPIGTEMRIDSRLARTARGKRGTRYHERSRCAACNCQTVTRPDVHRLVPCFPAV
jgi:hypothetical protein